MCGGLPLQFQELGAANGVPRGFFALLVTCAFICVCNVTVTLAKEASITREEARSLVLAELERRGYHTASPKFELDDNKGWVPGYYTFDAYFDTADRLAHIDTYSVDPRSAELWEDGLCKIIKTPSVRRLQKELRAERQLPVHSKQKYAPCDTFHSN